MMKTAISLGCVWLLIGTSLGSAQRCEHFITRQGDRLMDGTKEYRFISFNIPNLHYVEDQLPFAEMNPWRLPDAFEITDALTAIEQMGGQETRLLQRRGGVRLFQTGPL